LRIFRRIIPCQKLESWGYQMVYISRSCFRSARHNTGVACVRQTDGQTDRHVAVAKTRYSIYAVARKNRLDLGGDLDYVPYPIPDHVPDPETKSLGGGLCCPSRSSYYCIVFVADYRTDSPRVAHNIQKTQSASDSRRY